MKGKTPFGKYETIIMSPPLCYTNDISIITSQLLTYVLMQSKCLEAYMIVLSNIVFQTDWKLQPKSITSDFEQGLMTSLQQEFGKDIPYISYEFHWKQAIRRKLISY